MAAEAASTALKTVPRCKRTHELERQRQFPSPDARRLSSVTTAAHSSASAETSSPCRSPGSTAGQAGCCRKDEAAQICAISAGLLVSSFQTALLMNADEARGRRDRSFGDRARREPRAG